VTPWLLILAAPPSSLHGFLRYAEESRLSQLPLGERVAQVGLGFAGTPYVGGTLDTNPQTERCVVRWDGLDCFTFVELSWNLARLTEKDGRTPAGLYALVTETRYRGGRLDGYASRLHYASEWLLDNAARGLLDDLTPSLLGAVRDTRAIHFMTSHPASYPALRSGNTELLRKLRQHEMALTRRERWFVPKSKVAAIEATLEMGDIVVITTDTPGLDASHVGMIVVTEDGVRRLLHASSDQRKVVLDGRLSDYLARNRSQTGIMVGRPRAND
jgi:hypothetical protein